MSNNWQDLVDVEKLTTWMDEKGIESGPLSNFLPLTGGTQNLLLRFKRASSQYVLRRPPLHTDSDSATTMHRESRILGALSQTNIPHPRLIASCNEQSVLGASFFLMEPIDGFTPIDNLPEKFADNTAFCHQIGFAMVDAAAELGNVDYLSVGLEGFGKIEGFLERQAGRWNKQFESYSKYDSWSGEKIQDDVDLISSWLSENCPKQFKPGVVHGDYHLGNVMFHHDKPELAAIVDWELCTLGDPLIDLGWLVATWPEPDGTGLLPKLEAKPWHGFATTDELIERYAQSSDRDISNMSWYVVLACYKLGIILEGTYARACAGKAPIEIGNMLHLATLKLFSNSLKWMSR